VPARVFDLPLLVPGIRLDRDAAAETRRALERAREPWVAGFVLFGGEARAVARLTASLRQAAGRPLFVASDMEYGAGQQVEGLSHLPDLGVYGLAATPLEVEDLAERTALEARSVGVDVLFAPVLDVRSEPSNPIVGNRSFGWDPVRVGLLGAAYCRGALRGGAAPVAKHFPGHGATVGDSHDAVPVVRERLERLLARDLAPFVTALVDGGCPAVMTAHVAYPALDRSGAIASYSAAILDRLRAAAPDPDLVCAFTDALLMEGAKGVAHGTTAALAGGGRPTAAEDAVGAESAGAIAALRAGCDALLYPEEPERVATELAAVRAEGGLGDVADRAAERVVAFHGAIALAGERRAPSAPLAEDTPLEVCRRAVRLAGAGVLRPEAEWLLVLDDDDVAHRGRVLAEAGRKAGVPVTVARIGRQELAPEADPPPRGATVVVMARVRAWKGASGVSPALTARLEHLERHAALRGTRLDQVWMAPRPGRRGVHLPGTGPDLERALAEVLFPGAADA
jgi:beta-glucosidase-like glycosyl hydrolase